MPEDVPGDDADDAGQRSAPDLTTVRDSVLRDLVGFVRVLRANGAAVPANAAQDAAAALAVVGLEDRVRVETALQTTLVSRPADLDVLADHFPAFWARLQASLTGTDEQDRALGPDGDDAGPTATTRTRRQDDSEADARDGTQDAADEGSTSDTLVSARVDDASRDDADTLETARRPGSYSAVGRRSRPDSTVGSGNPPLDEADVRAFERAVATLRGRRYRRAPGVAVDRRRALRRSLSTGGVPMVLPERTPAVTTVRTTVLVDVSRSVVDSVDRGFLLAFLAHLADAGRSTRTFFFDTELRDVTDVFERDAGEDPAAALERASIEWGGGTRIGDALLTLRREHRDAVDRRTVVIVVSDGLDVGEMDALERGMTWLAGRSRAVLWLNPLAASPAYEPTARGMATALPYLDALFPFADSGDLATAARRLERDGLDGDVASRVDAG